MQQNDTLLQRCQVLYLDHTAVTTPDLQQTLREYLSLEGSKLLKGPGENVTQKVNFAFVELPNGSVVEILSPIKGTKSPILEHVKAGAGVYHFCYAVQSIEHAVQVAEKLGASILVSPIEDVAFSGRKVAFLFSKFLGLFEFVEAFPQNLFDVKSVHSQEK
jgi:methylmalonyl-CoA/ethylmalonyl-CoA epimerase